MRTNKKLAELWLGRRLLGQKVERATAALPQTAALAIFTITGGRIMLASLIGEVTTLVGAVANVTRFTHIATGPLAEQNLCAALTDINALALGSFMGMTGVPTDGMLTGLGTIPGQTMPIFLATGTIYIRCAGSDGAVGRVKYSIRYIPYDDAASVAAA
jgi:hypothetical protein